MTETCAGSEAFACEVTPGREIHDVPKPQDEYHCPTIETQTVDFRLNPQNKMCYAFTKYDHGASTSFYRPDAEKYCNDYSSTLVTIQSLVGNKQRNFPLRYSSLLDSKMQNYSYVCYRHTSAIDCRDAVFRVVGKFRLFFIN